MGVTTILGKHSIPWMGPKLPWHDQIAHRPDFWFGRPFWVSVVVCTFLLPGLEMVWLCTADLPPMGAGLLALANIVAAGVLFSLAWGLTSFGTHFLTAPVRLFNVLKRVCPTEYAEIQSAGRQYRRQLKQSQKDNLIEEQVETPYSYKIFTRYIWRVSFVILTIPLYLGLAMLALRVVPGAHVVKERGGFVEIVQALEVFRDIQMGMLGGTSTEHLPERNEIPVVAQTAEKRDQSSGDLASQHKKSIQSGPSRREAHPSFPLWRPMAWEIVGIFCTFVYVSVALILLPLQFGIVANLDSNLKSRDFWAKQLEIW
ncbi:MAG: hypothetical protein AABO58_25365 [Acidobacteriota bacterium]